MSQRYTVRLAVNVIAGLRQRVLPLFLVLLMASSAMMPAGQAMAQAAQQRDRSQKSTHPLLPDAAKDKVKPRSPDADKPMKQDYPGALAIKQSSSKLAADYQPATLQNGGGLLSDGQVNALPAASTEGLQAPGVSHAHSRSVKSWTSGPATP